MFRSHPVAQLEEGERERGAYLGKEHSRLRELQRF